MFDKTLFHFELSERKLLLRILDVSFVLLGLHLLGITFDFDYFTIREDKCFWSLLLGIYILFFGEVFEIYDLKKSSNFFKIFKAIVVTSSITMLVYILTPYFSPELPESRLEIVLFYLTIIFSMLLGRVTYLSFINSPIFIKNIVLIADGEYFNEIEKDLLNADSNYKIKYFINTNQDFEKKYTEKQIHVAALNDIAKNDINEIVVTRNSKFSSPTLYNDLLHLFNTGKVVKEYSEVYEELSGKVYISLKNKDLYKQFPFSEHNVKPLFKLVHRMFDIIVSIIGLLVMLLMIPFLVSINFFANKGPLFYKQERVGKKGKLFSIIKLRSMVIDAERNGAVWADKNDSRVTPFGKFLRKTRLDEIPQFFNILKGEMSIIGPRPERSVFVDQLADKIPFYPTRHIIKPGLTGWAQVNTSYGASVDESLLKLQYDLYYIKHRNLFLDFNIIMKTLTTVLFFRGQ